MPVDVQVGDRVVRLPMTGGHGTLAVPAGAHVVLDPAARILKRSPAVEQYRAWQEGQRARTAPK